MNTKIDTYTPTEWLEIDDLRFHIQRSPRRKTIELIVERGGELSVHAPCTYAEPEIRAWIKSKLLWVHQKLARKAAILPQRNEPKFISGESFSYLGRNYRLQLVEEQRELLRFDGHQFYLRADARSSAAQQFRAWYRHQGYPWLTARIQALTKQVGVTPTRIEIRELAYRWGSCGQNQQLYFHWKLLQLPVHLIDYVIVHELAHLVEPNHGPAFWACVERALPDWQDRKLELDSSGALFLRMST